MHELTEVVFRRLQGGRVGLSTSSLTTFKKYRQLRVTDREAGGVLIGRLVTDAVDLMVDTATVPARSDLRQRFRFFRKASSAQGQVDRAWVSSSGTQNYLGEWHSHPEDDPLPSPMDVENWHRIVSSASFEQAFLLFVIVGRRSLGMWELSRKLDLVRLSEERSNQVRGGPTES